MVFRPPPPTYLRPTRYFYLDVEMPDIDCNTCGAMSSSIPDPPSEGGKHRIPAFFIRSRDAKITILYSHGNAEDLGMMYNRMKEIARLLCVNVMAYDYTGYGYSTGRPNEKMCFCNIEAAYKYLTTVRNIPPSQIVLYGRSLGSGPSCYLAAKTAKAGQSISAMVLHSPFLSVYRVVVDCGFDFYGDMFRNVSYAPDIRCPVLVIHGTQDEVVPFWHGQELLQSLPKQCRAEPFWAEGLGHNNIELYLKTMYMTRVRDFLDRYVPARWALAHSNGMRDASEQSTLTSQPVAIPEKEQAKVGPTERSSSKFHLNSAWVKYGTSIMNEAVYPKKSKETQRARAQQLSHKNSNAGAGRSSEDGLGVRKTTIHWDAPKSLGAMSSSKITSERISPSESQAQGDDYTSGSDSPVRDRYCTTQCASSLDETSEESRGDKNTSAMNTRGVAGSPREGSKAPEKPIAPNAMYSGQLIESTAKRTGPQNPSPGMDTFFDASTIPQSG